MKKAALYGMILAAALCLADRMPVNAQVTAQETAQETESRQETESTQETEAIEREDSSDSVYQKLQKGTPVRVAVLGDSIGSGTGTDEEHAWDNLLKEWLGSQYESEVTFDNYAVGGTGSFTGYFQSENAMREAAPYDLVLICYGQNDKEENFYLTYEGVLRSVKKYNPDSQIITVLESSQRLHTGKMHVIVRLSYLYGADVADLVRDFALSGIPYELLCPDGTHPNAEGHWLYFESVRSVIEENVKAGKGPVPLPEPSEDAVRQFENCEYVPLEDCVYVDGEYRIVTDRPVLGLVFRHSGYGSDILLHFSTREDWESTGKTDINKVWTEAVLVDPAMMPGTLVILPDPDGNMDQTVEGFVVAGA